MNRVKVLGVGCLLSAGMSSAVWADGGMRTYEVTITNLTRGQSLTPVLVATHRGDAQVFETGMAPSMELAVLAEGGDTGPLNTRLSAMPGVTTTTTMGLIGPGQSATVTIAAARGADRLSLGSMLIPTNDAFFGLDSVALPHGAHVAMHVSPTYDAGSEPNDELCANIPGPACGGAGGSPDAGGEGFVHVHAGIHGIGDLSAAQYDWRNPAVKIVVRRTRE